MKIDLYRWDDCAEGGILVVPYISIEDIISGVNEHKPIKVIAPFHEDPAFNVRTASMLKDRLDVPVLCVISRMNIIDMKAFLHTCTPELDGFAFRPGKYAVSNMIQFVGDYLNESKHYHSAGEEFEWNKGQWTWSVEGI